jgi:peroxiredoxin Q/BCP
MTQLARRLAAAPLALATVIGWSCGGGGLEVGSPVPAATAPDQDGRPVDLAAEAANGFTLVYFFPAAGSPGCTAQACSLRDRHDELVASGVRVYGVSVDGPKTLKGWRDELRLPFTLISDHEKQVATAFGVPRPGGFAKRQAYLFKDGRLVWKDTSASTEDQAADVLAAVAQAG